MLTFRLTLYRSQKEALKKSLKTARNLGANGTVNRILSILAIAEGIGQQQVADTLQVSVESQSAFGFVPFYCMESKA